MKNPEGDQELNLYYEGRPGILRHTPSSSYVRPSATNTVITDKIRKQWGGGELVIGIGHPPGSLGLPTAVIGKAGDPIRVHRGGAP